MFKKLLAVTLVLVGMSFAQTDVWGAPSTANTSSSGWNSASPSVNQKPESEDLKFALAAHPVILGVMGAQGMFFWFFTFEAGFGNSFSLITRPVFVSGKWENVSESGFGIVEGFRFYLSGKGHKGFYLEPEFQYVSVDAHYKSSYASASGVGFYFLAGYKIMDGHFVFGIDGGIGFNMASASRDGIDVKLSSAEGFGTDFNMYIGFAL